MKTAVQRRELSADPPRGGHNVKESAQFEVARTFAFLGGRRISIFARTADDQGIEPARASAIAEKPAARVDHVCAKTLDCHQMRGTIAIVALAMGSTPGCSRSGLTQPEFEEGTNPADVGTKACGELNRECHSDAECCSGRCESGMCGGEFRLCDPDGSSCSPKCCAGACDAHGKCGRERTPSGCGIGGTSCSDNSICCTRECRDGSCTYAACYPGDPAVVIATDDRPSGKIAVTGHKVVFSSGNKWVSAFGGDFHRIGGGAPQTAGVLASDTEAVAASVCIRANRLDGGGARTLGCAGAVPDYSTLEVYIARHGDRYFWNVLNNTTLLDELVAIPVTGGSASLVATGLSAWDGDDFGIVGVDESWSLIRMNWDGLERGVIAREGDWCMRGQQCSDPFVAKEYVYYWRGSTSTLFRIPRTGGVRREVFSDLSTWAVYLGREIASDSRFLYVGGVRRPGASTALFPDDSTPVIHRLVAGGAQAIHKEIPGLADLKTPAVTGLAVDDNCLYVALAGKGHLSDNPDVRRSAGGLVAKVPKEVP